MSRKHGSSQVIKPFIAIFALVLLSGRLGFIMTSFDDMPRMAVRTYRVVRPSQTSYGLVALRVADQTLDVYHWLKCHFRSPAWNKTQTGDYRNSRHRIKPPESKLSYQKLSYHPQFGYNTLFSMMPGKGFELSFVNYKYLFSLVQYWMKIFLLGKESLMTIIRKNMTFLCFSFLMFGLCFLSLFYTNGQDTRTAFERYWFSLAILLTGMVAHFLVLIFAFFLYFLKKQIEPTHENTSIVPLPRWEWGMAVVLLGGGILVQAIHQQDVHAHIGEETLSQKIESFANSGNYAFDPTQPAMLQYQDYPCNKVLYVDGGVNFINESSNLLVYSNFLNGAMKCGAIRYSMLMDPKNVEPRELYTRDRDAITHIAFINQVHTIPVPVSVGEGHLRFQFWKESRHGPWRFFLKNPGPNESVLTLKRLADKDLHGEELARFTLQSGWEGWVETPIPTETIGKRYALSRERGPNVLLQGVRLGTGKEDLLWPWDQGLEMSFLNYRIEHRRRSEKIYRTTHFTSV